MNLGSEQGLREESGETMRGDTDVSAERQPYLPRAPRWYRWASVIGACGFVGSAVATAMLSHDTVEVFVGRLAAGYVALAVVSGVALWALHRMLFAGRASYSGSWYIVAGLLCPVIGALVVYGVVPLLAMEAPAVLGAVAMPCLGLAVGGELAQLVHRHLAVTRNFAGE